MNKLSFITEHVTYDSGYEIADYTAYFYVVDGKKLEFDNDYRPASKYEILTDTYVSDSHQHILLNCCSCGYWECDCCSAEEIIEGNIVKWKLYGTPIKDDKEYIFDKTEYDKVINEIRNTALNEMTLAIKIYYQNGDSTIFDFDSEKDLKKMIEIQSQEGFAHVIAYENLKTGEYHKVK